MNYLEKFKDVRTFIFDVDGVLTNSELIVLESGGLLRKMSVRDGYAIKHAIKNGYRIAIITGGKSEGVVTRLKGLGVEDIYSGIDNKVDAYEELVYTYDLNPTQILYMGDDFPDIEVMHKVGIAACPKDAAHEVISAADYISPVHGGKGCARDVIEKVMRLHGKWTGENDN
ncbi:MAG TPA: 3-deoxy-D-manno-octulosonate 8-phosphate phosphatase [Phaeodactylibacter sp.]|nr:3-deoxy-D-manno-octulosonate 8-phosphate phosphatase [Phaeodactylibacter sp.]